MSRSSTGSEDRESLWADPATTQDQNQDDELAQSNNHPSIIYWSM